MLFIIANHSVFVYHRRLIYTYFSLNFNYEVSAMIEFNKLSVGKVICRLRKEKGISQEVFSGLAGLARSHLAMIETGDKQPNFETIWRIANAFDIKPHELVKLIEEAEK